jgi:predicted phosphate transport protein (TIGR00153 family)
MFRAVEDGATDRLQSLTDDVFRLGHAANKIKMDIRERLPRALLRPALCGDLLILLAAQDDLADAVEKVAVLLTLKRLDWPTPVGPQIHDYVQQAATVCEQTRVLRAGLTQLAIEGVAPGSADRLQAMIRSLEQAEADTDRPRQNLNQALFALEGQMPPTDVFLWSRIIDQLGFLVRCAETIGEQVRCMLPSRSAISLSPQAPATQLA